jgi:protein SCO1/2
MVQAVDLLGEQAPQVQPLFISLDPARDTPAKLTDYVTAFHPRLVGLTGPEDSVAATARKYRIKVEKVATKDGSYGLNHTAAIFLMGPDGAFLDRFLLNKSAAQIAERIKSRMAEPPNPAH